MSLLSPASPLHYLLTRFLERQNYVASDLPPSTPSLTRSPTTGHHCFLLTLLTTSFPPITPLTPFHHPSLPSPPKSPFLSLLYRASLIPQSTRKDKHNDRAVGGRLHE